MTTPRKRPGPRVVKGRSEKQRAAAKRYSAFRAMPTAIDANPSTSWWVGKNRAELQAAAAEQQPRIGWSKCGRVKDPTYAHE